MFIDPVQLIDETIDRLQTLAAHFEDETGAGLPAAATLSPSTPPTPAARGGGATQATEGLTSSERAGERGVVARACECAGAADPLPQLAI